jgi:beta-lactamase superfamily II metal-dependent hydrolase
MADEVKFVKAFKDSKRKTRFKATLAGDDGEEYTLIWGDRCKLLEPLPASGQAHVRARGHEGKVDVAALGDEQLLEVYLIDVGQGDGILLHTPDDEWHLIDGGERLEDQMLNKGAPNFIRWKFRHDLERDTVTLKNVILTHPDADHFGGLIDVLGGNFGHPEDDPALEVEVGAFLHSGIAKFAVKAKKDILGPVTHGAVDASKADALEANDLSVEDDFLTELLEGKKSFSDPRTPKFAPEYGELAALVGEVVGEAVRLDDRNTKFLEGYGESDEVTIRVLGPILEEFEDDGGDAREGLRVLGDPGETANGHSVVLRVEYEKASILLTGDLNEPSQQLLLSYRPAKDFEVEVAKACHHGSEKIHLPFIAALHARATIISSGDNEGFSHPRPVAMGASAHYGRDCVDATGTSPKHGLPPLVYSTELARSVRLENVGAVKAADDDVPVEDVDVRPAGKGKKFRPLDETGLYTDLLYGLVNVRTDGELIMCATKEEEGEDFDVLVFMADADPPEPL